MSPDTTYGRTIQLFLVDGRPTGLRKATIHGWTGLLFVSGNSTFGKLTARDEVDRTGVYVLSGPDPDKADAIRVYIGSGNSVAERIKQSAQKREFWETAITVTTSDDDLSKGHAEYLEARLIELTSQADRVTLDNSTKPDIARRRLPEADVANMEQFLASLRVILPVIGMDMLKPQPRAATQTAQSLEARISGDVQFEILQKSGLHAIAVEEEGEFVVLEGSRAKPGTPSENQYGALRRRLIKEGVLVNEDQTGLTFKRPFSFNSPTAAASTILDRNANGRTEWKVIGTKQTYHEWQQAQAAKKEAAE